MFSQVPLKKPAYIYWSNDTIYFSIDGKVSTTKVISGMIAGFDSVMFVTLTRLRDSIEVQNRRIDSLKSVVRDTNKIHSDTLLSHNDRINAAKQVPLDSMATARTELNLHKDTLVIHDTRINLAIQRYLDSLFNHRTFMNLDRDSLVSHNTRILTAIQRSLDSVLTARGELNWHKDTLTSHNNRINLARQEARDTSNNIRSTLNAKGDSIYFYPKLMIEAILNSFMEWGDTSTTIANKIFVANTYATLSGMSAYYSRGDTSSGTKGFHSRDYMTTWMNQKADTSYGNSKVMSTSLLAYKKNIADSLGVNDYVRNWKLGEYETRGDTNTTKHAITLSYAVDNFCPIVSATNWNTAYTRSGKLVDDSTKWNTAYDDRLKWDGGSSGLTATTGRTSLGLNNGAMVDTIEFGQKYDARADTNTTKHPITLSYAVDHFAPIGATNFKWNKSGEAQVSDSIRIIAGANITLTQSNNTLTITAASGAGGEVNTASNLAGLGIGIWKDKSTYDLRFKRLKALGYITITDMTDSVSMVPDTSALKLATKTDVAAKQNYDADLTTYAGISPSANAQTLLGQTFAQMRGSLVAPDSTLSRDTVYSNSVSKLNNGTGTTVAAGGGKTYKVSINTSQNIATLSNLTQNGWIKTSGNNGTLGVDSMVCLFIPLDSSWVNTTDTSGLFYTDRAITISSIRVAGQGTAMNIVADYMFGANANLSGSVTKLLTSPAASTSVTTGTVVSSFDNASIPAGSWIKVRFPTVTTKQFKELDIVVTFLE